MITGEVDPRRHIVLTLELHGPSSQKETVRFLLDTGFNGALSLPMSIVDALELVQFDSVFTNLADGSRIEVPYYRVVVLWDGEERVANVIASGNQPLIGTSLLHGHKLTVEIIDGGQATISLLSPPWT